MKDLVIETHGLKKSFASRSAVTQLDWQVPEGSLVGLLGPNGAGKTTTLKMLVGIIRPSAGTARVLGCDILRQSLQIRRDTAFVPEDKIAYDSLTGSEFLKMYGSFFPDGSAPEATHLAKRWSIPLNQKFRVLSRGARGRLLLIAALSRRPRLLLLDEPAEGLDPAATEEVLQHLTQWIAEGGRSAVLATHRLDEVERICDRIALMAGGALVLSGDLDDLRSKWKRIDAPLTVPEDEVALWKQVRSVRSRRGRLSITTHDDPGAVMERLRALCAAGETIQASDMNLREIYLAAVPPHGGIPL